MALRARRILVLYLVGKEGRVSQYPAGERWLVNLRNNHSLMISWILSVQQFVHPLNQKEGNKGNGAKYQQQWDKFLPRATPSEKSILRGNNIIVR